MRHPFNDNGENFDCVTYFADAQRTGRKRGLAKLKTVERPIDFRVENHGSIVILQPLTRAAKAWVEENLPADHQEWAGGVVVEPRYIRDIVDGAIADGLEVR